VKALVVASPGVIDLVDVPTPTASAGHELVRPLLTGLCGTDLELIDGTIDTDYVNYPLTLGHEWVGRRVDAGSDSSSQGDLVVVEGVIPCGVCEECLRGASNRCRIYDEIGFTRPGSLAEYVEVPSHLIHTLATNVSPLDAVLIEPMAVVWRALTRANISPGARCLVVGDGTVALLSAYLLRHFQPSNVTMLGIRPAQHDLSAQCGVDAFITDRLTEKFDVVIEAAGQVAAVQSALGAVGRGGTLVLLGLPAHGATVTVAPDQFVNDDLTMQGSFSYTRLAWRDVVALVNSGHLRPSFLVTHHFSLDQWDAAVASLRHATPGQVRGKIVISLDELAP
jgi:threonine dehydrogenase-like Zn-dependent dehydrogenase